MTLVSASVTSHQIPPWNFHHLVVQPLRRTI
jgi:hypothetical protein